MVIVYSFDSSGLVKRYVNETGTAWVNSILNPTAGNLIRVASITAVEVVSAISRRKRAGNISAAVAAAMLADFRHDFANEYRVVEITPPLITHAMALVETYGLRAYDAVQLAAALQVHAECLALGLQFMLISADAPLNAAAKVEGLMVDDPNNHP